MTTTLIVLAHPERNSFTGAWADASAKACADLGHKIVWSDLYAMKFDPVEKASHFKDHSAGSHFDMLKAQEAAAENGTIADDVIIEMDKVKTADQIIYHFPIWWFKEPAILKGWCDRVLANGAMHSVDERYDNGKFRGKHVLFCVSTGANAHECAFNGKEGDIEMLLWPMAHTMRYLGFKTYKSVVINGVHSYHTGKQKLDLEDTLTQALAAQSDVIKNLNTRDIIQFNSDNDFDENGTLLKNAKSHSAFIRHEK